MVRWRSVACLVLAGLLAGASEPPSWVPAFQSASNNLEAGRCKEALTDARTLRAAEIGADIAVDVRHFAHLVTLICSFDLKQFDQAMAAGREALLLDPKPSKILDIWVLAALGEERPKDAMDALLFALQRNPASVNHLPPETLYDLFGALERAGSAGAAEDLKVKLVTVGYGGDYLGVADDLREEAVRAALKAGDTRRALEVAEMIVHPDSLVRLLTLNRYQDLWPALEARVGPGMSVAKARAVNAARRIADGQVIPEMSPDAAEAQRQLVQILWLGGQRDEAIRLGAQAFASPAALADISERGGWLVNTNADQLAADGQIDAADRRWSGITDLGIETRRWLIGPRINQVMARLDHGRAEATLAALPGLKADVERYGNGYARQLVRMTEVCALAARGRADEAQPTMGELIRNVSDSHYAVIRAHMCLGDDASAAAVLVSGLEDSKAQEGLVSDLQPLLPSDDPRGPSLRPLLERPEVAAAYARVGRDLPEALR